MRLIYFVILISVAFLSGLIFSPLKKVQYRQVNQCDNKGAVTELNKTDSQMIAAYKGNVTDMKTLLDVPTSSLSAVLCLQKTDVQKQKEILNLHEQGISEWEQERAEILKKIGL